MRSEERILSLPSTYQPGPLCSDQWQRGRIQPHVSYSYHSHIPYNQCSPLTLTTPVTRTSDLSNWSS